MAILTIDASLAMKWVNREEDSAAAGRLLTEKDDRDEFLHQLVAPAFLLMEVHYALSKRFILGQISKDQLLEGPSFVRDQVRLEAVDSGLVAEAEWIANSAERAGQDGFKPFSIYDSVYLALAKRSKCPLVTADKKQSEIASAHGLEVLLIGR